MAKKPSEKKPVKSEQVNNNQTQEEKENLNTIENKVFKSEYEKYSSKYDLETSVQKFFNVELNRWKHESKPRRENWKNIIDLYNCKTEWLTKDKPSKKISKDMGLCLPWIVTSLEDTHSRRIRYTLSPENSIFDIEADDNLKIAADYTSRYLHAKFRKHIVPELSRAIKHAGLVGLSAVEIFPKEETTDICFYDPRKGEEVEDTITVFSGVKAEALNTMNWYFDTNKNAKTGLFCREYERTINYLLDLEEDGLFFGIDRILQNQEQNQQKQTLTGKSKELNDNKKSSKAANDLTDNYETGANLLQTVLIQEYHGDITLFNTSKNKWEVLSNMVVYIAEERFIIGIHKNHYMDGQRPFIFIENLSSADIESPFPVNLIYLAKDYILLGNEIINAMKDAVKRVMKDNFTYDPSDEKLIDHFTENGGYYEPEPGEGIPSRYGIKEFRRDSTGVVLLSFDVVDQLKGEFCEATYSLKDLTNKQYQKTATEISGILQQQSDFWINTIQNDQNNVIIPAVEKTYSMMKQFFIYSDLEAVIKDMINTLQEPDMLQKLQENGLTVEDLFRDWSFTPTGNQYLTLKAQRINDLNTFVATISKLQGANDWLKLKNFVMTTANQLQLFNADDIIKTEEEYQTAKQQLMDEAMQMEAMNAKVQADLTDSQEISKKEAPIRALQNIVNSSGK